MVDTAQEIGICLYVFTGICDSGEPVQSSEGLAEWIAASQVGSIPVVEDLPILLNQIRSMQKGDPPFCARSFYDDEQRLTVVFGS